MFISHKYTHRPLDLTGWNGDAQKRTLINLTTKSDAACVCFCRFSSRLPFEVAFFCSLYYCFLLFLSNFSFDILVLFRANFFIVPLSVGSINFGRSEKMLSRSTVAIFVIVLGIFAAICCNGMILLSVHRSRANRHTPKKNNGRINILFFIYVTQLFVFETFFIGHSECLLHFSLAK